MKKLAMIGVIALVVVGFVIAAGCTAAPGNSDSGDKWLTSNYDSGTGIALTKVKTTDKGVLSAIVKTGDPVIGVFGNANQGVAYEFLENGTAYRYTTDKDGNLFDKTEKMWGKLDGTDSDYVIINLNYGDGYIVYTYAAGNGTLAEKTTNDPVILTKTKITKTE